MAFGNASLKTNSEGMRICDSHPFFCFKAKHRHASSKQQTLPKTIDTDESGKFLKSFLTSLGCDLGFIEEAGKHRLQFLTRHSTFALRIIEMKNSFLKSVRNFLASEDGPTAVEYAVMLALIVVVCLASVSALGSNANAKFNKVKTALS